MDIERETLVTLFKGISYTKLIKLLTGVHGTSQNADILRTAFLEALPQEASNRTKEEHLCYANRLKPMLDSEQGVFEALFDFCDSNPNSDRVFSDKGDGLRCRKEHILRWRSVTYKLGQDLFIAAHYAAKEPNYADRKDAFTWGPALRSNNYQLNEILDRGLAENHYHLNASAQIFPLAWCSLMNHIAGRAEEVRQLKALMSPKLSYDLNSDSKYTLSFYSQCIVAAALRVDLFRLNSRMESSTEMVSPKGSGDFYWWRQMLGGGNTLHPEFITGRLQRDIGALLQRSWSVNYAFGTSHLDYMLNQSLDSSVVKSQYRALAGERHFLYRCLRHIHQDRYSAGQRTAFQLYLLLKSAVRDELIQTNDAKGLQNFIEYEKRKELFIDNHPQFNAEKIRLAVAAPLLDQKIKSLELRLAPKDNAEGNQMKLKEIEDIAQNDLERHPEPEIGSFHYVLHFPRKEDRVPQGKRELSYLRHRHLRKTVMEKTAALLSFRRNYSLASRLKGIDVCSNEIGCRPEVFAPAFRRLRQPFPLPRVPRFDVPALGMTYHAGESFYDIADGLRAIDEAVTFCNYGAGDRLGHALALGVDPSAYYIGRGHTLILPKQELLDNIVWLLKRWENHSSQFDSLKACLEEEAQKLLDELYSALRPLNIDTYFNAWKLRGDAPEYYQSKPNLDVAPAKAMESLLHFPVGGAEYALTPLEEPDLRLRSPVWDVAHEYLYNATTAKLGAEPALFKVSDEYEQVVSAIQEEMCRALVHRDIMIEANPSSNLLIGPIDRYIEHPIFKSFSPDAAEPWRNLSVSINTDDQGIFDTSLENEYALLACALSKEYRDSSHEIYLWIEEVRKTGFRQSFGKAYSMEPDLVGV